MALERIMEAYDREQVKQAKRDALQSAMNQRLEEVRAFMLREQMERIAVAIDAPLGSIEGNQFRFEDFYIEVEEKEKRATPSQYQAIFSAFEPNEAIDAEIMYHNRYFNFPNLIGEAFGRKGEWASASAYPIWQSRLGITEEAMEMAGLYDSRWGDETYHHDPSAPYHFHQTQCVLVPVAGVENPNHNALAAQIRKAQAAAEAGKQWVHENAERLVEMFAEMLKPASPESVPVRSEKIPCVIVGFDPQKNYIDYLNEVSAEVNAHLLDGYRFAGVMPQAIILIHRNYHPTVEAGILAAGEY